MCTKRLIGSIKDAKEKNIIPIDHNKKRDASIILKGSFLVIIEEGKLEEIDS